ncbi:MAG: hypothetical protein NPIRA05_02960 [Nitrospirales bacterium]|nr:MAG: hypothetical protein NPIRA05_02960 [Nitrospirales bacterium]
MEHQSAFLGRLNKKLPVENYRANSYGFVGNIANNMMMRAQPMRKDGYDIDVVLHPQDRYVMSRPGWELSDLVLPEGISDVDELAALGMDLPHVDWAVDETDQINAQKLINAAHATPPYRWRSSHQAASYMRQLDVLLYDAYLNYQPLLDRLQKYDALFASQAPYLAYLSGKPYLAAQTGGDLYFEASRDDMFGRLQRGSYQKAKAILATNPWTFSAARRFGFKHVLYAPLLIDVDVYKPGPRRLREEWIEKTGDGFFVLATARLDLRWKGSDVALEGFKRFASKNPQARLLLVGWGSDVEAVISDLSAAGLSERVIVLPVAGKKRLRDYLRSADCVLDQFKVGYYGGTALEAMACGAPVIMRLLTEQYDALCKTGAPPVLNAGTPDEVAVSLQTLIDSKQTQSMISQAGIKWIEQNHTANVWGDTYGMLLAASAEGVMFDFSGSPLQGTLSDAEKEYHASALASAPTFPNYV